MADNLTVMVWALDFSEFKSPAAKLVALAIARRSRGSGASWAKQSTIAQDTGVSKQTVARCLQELEEAAWLKRVNRRRNDGSRTSDMLWLTLPETTLSATTVDAKEAKRLLGEAEDDGATVETQDATVMSGKLPACDLPPTSVTTQKESLKDSRLSSSVPDGDAMPPVDFEAAVTLIWQRASKVGRQRSSKADIEKALRAAVGRGHAIDRVLKGLGAYFASPDATKDDGAYQRGAHVVLANDRWASFLDDEEARRDAGETVTPAAAAVQEDLGTLEAPSLKRQHLWMDLFRQGMPWDPARGPRPGMMGCRVPDDVQRAYGVEPYAPPADDGEAAAFD